MTIPATTRKAGPLLGNGSTTAFPFTFKVFAASDIKVTIANNLGTETVLVLNTDYTVTLNPNQETSPGGTVTYPISGSALPSGSTLTIIGNLPYDQPLDLPSGGNFSPLALENQLDRLTMQIQQLREQVGRALTVPVNSTASPTLPMPEASSLIAWNENANGLENYPIADLATALAFATFRYDTFTGDGATTQYTLSADPITLGNLDVAVGGVTQIPGVDYTLASGVLQFTSAPPNGVSILARFGEGIVSGPSMDSYDVRFQPAGTGAVQRTVESKLRDVVSVKDFGAVGDGVIDDTAAIQSAFAAAPAGEIDFPPGTYRVSSGPLVIPDGAVIRFYGRSAKIDFRGTGACFEVRNSKNIALYDINVDLTNAGAAAVGLRVRGCWWLNIYKPKFQGGNAGQTLIQIETSQTGGNDWGSYLLEISNPQLSGTAGYGINCFRTSGDSVDVTHLNIYGGWSKSCNYGLHMRQVTGFQIRGFVADTGVDGINIGNCADGLLEPGELGPNTGYGINFSTGNSAIHLIAPNMAGVGGTLGYINTSNYTPQYFDQGKLRVYGSRSDQSYYASFESQFSYAQSFLIRHKGSTTESIIMEAGEAAGTTVRGTTGSGKVIKLDGKSFFCPTRFAPTYGASVAIDASLGMQFNITATNGTAFTIANPTNVLGDGQVITITVRNTSGGALGTITWDTQYKLSAWTNPATGNSRSITFQWNTSNWVEISRTPADVPN